MMLLLSEATLQNRGNGQRESSNEDTKAAVGCQEMKRGKATDSR